MGRYIQPFYKTVFFWVWLKKRLNKDVANVIREFYKPYLYSQYFFIIHYEICCATLEKDLSIWSNHFNGIVHRKVWNAQHALEEYLAFTSREKYRKSELGQRIRGQL